MATRLTPRWERTNTVKLQEQAGKLRDDAISGAVKARAIKDIREGNFENIANLQAVTGAFDNDEPVKMERTILVFEDKNKNQHEVNSESNIASDMIASPDYTHISTRTEEF
mgnify:CR=1 FL=1|tara:strand:+ start:174 stop:506 length:333 start_codon:yes stop_codon:yes gene_type:complete